MPQILDGKATAAAIKNELTERVEALKARGITPGLGTVLVGDDPASHSYVGAKHRDCAEIGINSIRVDLPQTSPRNSLRPRLISSITTPPAPATLCSFPCLSTWTLTVFWRRSPPRKTLTGCTPPTSASWC